MFVNTLVLRNQPAGEKTFKKFLKEVKEETLKAYENQEYPYDKLVEKKGRHRDKSRGPLAAANFVLQNVAMEESDMAVLQSVSYLYGQVVSYYELRFEGYEKEQRLCFTVEYLLKLFKEETIKKFIGYYKSIVSSSWQTPVKKYPGYRYSHTPSPVPPVPRFPVSFTGSHS